MSDFSSELAQINHQKAIAKYFGISLYDLFESQRTGLLFGQKSPNYIRVGDTAFYRKEAIDTFLGQFLEQAGDGL